MAGSLSGGEQQMLAIGRALTSRRRCFLLNEPTLGLGPIIVAEIERIVRVRGTLTWPPRNDRITALI